MTDKELFVVCVLVVFQTIAQVILWVLLIIATVILLAGVASGLEHLAEKLRR